MEYPQIFLVRLAVKSFTILSYLHLALLCPPLSVVSSEIVNNQRKRDKIRSKELKKLPALLAYSSSDPLVPALTRD